MSKTIPILIFGYPGSGKSVQAKIVANRFNIPYISTGKLIKKYIDSSKGGFKAKRVKKRYQDGRPQSNNFVISLIRSRLESLDLSKSKSLILDNFPFNKRQYQWWQEYSIERKFGLLRGIYLKIDQDVIYGRLEKRGRSDDNREVIDSRIEKYRPSIEFLTKKLNQDGNLYIINGEPPINQVSKRVISKIDEIID